MPTQNNTTESELNLVQKLSKIRKFAEAVKKDKKGYNYKYSDITNILAKITAGMEKYRVSLIPSIVPTTGEVSSITNVSTKVDKQGRTYDETKTEMLVTAEMVFTWINDDNPDDRMDVRWFLTGSQADPSQSFGSAITYCTRYFLISFFQIAQMETDVDAYRSKQKEAEIAEQKATLESIKGLIKDYVNVYLAANPERTDDVRKFMTQYVKDGDYRKVSEPVLASKILTEFENKFLKKTNF